MTLTREILNSHPISTLKKEISKTNIKGYSKMKKDEVVELMMKNKERFGHIKMAEKKKQVSKRDPKVQKIARDFEKAISKGKDVAERVRKTKDVKPKEEEGTRVARRTTADGEKVLVEMPVKTGSVVYEATGDNDEIGTWDAESKTVVPIPSSSPPKSSPPRSSPPKSSPPKPKSAPKSAVSPQQEETLLGLARDLTGKTQKQLNKLDIAELAGLLPKELRQQVLDPKKTGVKIGNPFEKAYNFAKARMDKLLEGTDFPRNTENEFKQQLVARILRGGTQTSRDDEDRRLLRGANVLNRKTSRIAQKFINTMTKAMEDPKKNVGDPATYVINLWADKQDNPERVRLALQEFLKIKINEDLHKVDRFPIVDNIVSQKSGFGIKIPVKKQPILGVKNPSKRLIGGSKFESSSVVRVLEYFQKLRKLNKNIKMKLSFGQPVFELNGERVHLKDDKVVEGDKPRLSDGTTVI